MAGVHSFPVVSYQPFRLVYQLISTAKVATKMPFWLVMFLIPRLRPNPRWTYMQSLLARVMYNVVHMTSSIAITEALTLKPGKEGDRFVIAPVHPEPRVYDLAPLNSRPDTIKPQPVGGTWFPSAPPTSSSFPEGDGPVILHFHGGAYVMGDGRTAGCGYLANSYLDQAGASAVFSAQYRLSSYGGVDPFPAALQDALTAYLYLTSTLSIPSSRVVLSGDSAGGNLAIALLRFLGTTPAIDSGIISTPPRAVVLSSPWVAPMKGLSEPTSLTGRKEFGSDYLPVNFLQWGARAYSDGLAGAEQNPYIELLGRPFETICPVFVTWGECEVFAADIAAWAEEMKGSNANGKVVTNVERDAPHDTFLAAELANWQGAVVETMGRVKGFLGEAGDAR